MIEGHVYEKEVNGRLISVEILTYGRGRVHIGPVGEEYYDDYW